ncbi:hypothetical protein VA596_25475 [Amycolatopsis sp., V23-08]|uniref:Uncharacterized protein n=1 Tax=Amycolatopsis heterodermiae TaxID=3110235 RepID=A0ABU5R9J9_9PSEU|nr:hypothetical protein [Amycolatopsis sp., V23-08]MEA5362908.1 hypothetical protein [Amycolatopsis sp., V23-08]
MLFPSFRKIHWALAGTALTLVAALASWLLWPSSSATAKPDPGPGHLVSYAAAAGRLAGLDATETDEQVRDWARLSLAARLQLDTAQVRDNLYDTFPLRDMGFADLTRQPTGPGRTLLDGSGTLHVLVPTGDPHEARTVGLALDQHRTDSGADASQVQVHHYAIDSAAWTIRITDDGAMAADAARAKYGYVSEQVGTTENLAAFLARTSSLSTVEDRGGELWAGGWAWPGEPTGLLDAEDVSVLQRGYAQLTGPTPGFSLDPVPSETDADLLASIPGLRPDLAARIAQDEWAGSPESSEDLLNLVDEALFDGDVPAGTLTDAGLPTDRTALWGVSNALTHRPVFSQARYDGGLAGTKVGMTLFYTDYVAKNWVADVGTGVPTAAVGGFVRESEAVTPWSECDGSGGADESGRLWFAQSDAGFAYGAGKVSLGANTTRLFSRADAPGGGQGDEVEPSYAAGRGLHWWDQHFQAVADYERQYERLDQIMRWSGALDWLVGKTSARLPQLPDSQIRSDLKFADWYRENTELKERGDVGFVTPPSAKQEAVVSIPSKASLECGGQSIRGGVSLGDRTTRTADKTFRASLPAGIDRAGLQDPSSTFDGTSGSGRIQEVTALDDQANVVDDVTRTLRPAPDGGSAIGVEATGRKVAPYGGLKVWRAEQSPRRFDVELRADHGRVSQRMSMQGTDLGELVATRQSADLVTVQWRRGLVDRVRTALESVQNRFASNPGGAVPPVTDGALYSTEDAGGRWSSRVGGPDEPWLSVGDTVSPPADALAFRLGGPDRAGEARFLIGQLAPHPTLDGPWLDVTSSPGHGTVVASVGGPPKNHQTVRVSAQDGKSADLSWADGHVYVPAGDPLLGVNGTVEGAALLRDFPRVLDAMELAGKARDGLIRAVDLGSDGVALVKPDEIQLLPAADPGAERVVRATGPAGSPPPTVRVVAGRLEHVDTSRLTTSASRTSDLGQVLGEPGADVYLHEGMRATLSVADGPILVEALPHDTKVTVREARLDDEQASQPVTAPDVRVYEGQDWQFVGGLGRGFVTGVAGQAPSIGTGTPSATTSTTPSGPSPQARRKILLVCPDTGQPLAGCTD